jgi:hypothetical protein
MIRNHTPITALAILLAAPLAGCVDSPGNAPDVHQGITAKMAAAPPESGDDLVIDSLVVQVLEVVFDADGPNDSISISEEQKIAADLSDGAFDGLTPIELTAGRYGSPYLGIEVWDDTTEPGIVLEGTLDGQAIRFEFNSGEVFEAESESVTVPDGEVMEVVLTLDPGAWFRNVDGTSLQVGDDGVALISETSNASVFDRVADRLDVTTDGRFPGGSDDDE